MSEKLAWEAFRANVPFIGDRVDRIENLVGSGFPDVNVCIGGVESWIEIKAPTEPRRAGTPLFGSNHKLSLEQRNWFLRQHQAGGIGNIYIETQQRRMLISGRHADLVNSLTTQQLVMWSIWHATRPTKGESWSALRAALAKRPTGGKLR